MVFYCYLVIYHPFPGPVPRHRVDWQVWGGGVFLKKGGRDERLRYYRDIQQDNCQRRLQTLPHLQAILCMEADCIPLIRRCFIKNQHHTASHISSLAMEPPSSLQPPKNAALFFHETISDTGRSWNPGQAQRGRCCSCIHSLQCPQPTA